MHQNPNIRNYTRMTTKQRYPRTGDPSAIKFLRRFSSIKVDFEKEKRKTLFKYQEHGLVVTITPPNYLHDKKEIRKRLRRSVERHQSRELYVKMICALFPGLKSKEMPDSNALVQHLKHVFRFSDQEHSSLVEIARNTKLPQRIINLEIVEAKDIPAKDANGLSDPFCVVFLNGRDIAQRTKVVENTLNPIWKQYFTFKVNDPSRDVLHIEVMDYNKEEEPLRDRFRKFKDLKSPSTFGILLKEIANARSVQELIGSLRIPVTEISSETLERWYKLKNHEDKGEIYLRMALGYNKSKETATDEFLQILHFFLVTEMEKETSLGTPFYWDEHYDMWSKYILRQFKWQGGLKPKDIVLAKWRAYTLINSIFPLNANMVCLLMDAVLERALNCEYDAREISRFWESTVLQVKTTISFLTELHDVLPCPVTVLHTYHMLKTLELLNQFLSQPVTCERGKVPFTKSGIIDLVTVAIKDGADKFYLKVFSDSTHDAILPDEDRLLKALARLLKMGQILHEDLRLGLSTIHTDFKGILTIDYQAITYQVYDEQFGKMVKFIIEEYNSQLLDEEADSEEALDEDSPAVKAGLAVFKLYLSVKNLVELAPDNYSSPSEYSLKQGLHHWFFPSVASWIDIILRKRIMKWVKNSVIISEGNACLTSESCTDSKLSKIDMQDPREIPISSSAVDTAQMFLEIHKFWMTLGWPCPHQSYLIVRKILEELYGFLIYYGAELQEAMRGLQESDNFLEMKHIHAYLYKGCTSINNINYVKEQVEIIGNQLNITKIIRAISLDKRGSKDHEDYEGGIELLKDEMESQVNSVIKDIRKLCINTISPKYNQLLLELPSDGIQRKRSSQSKRNSQDRVGILVDFIDNCLITLNVNLERGNFQDVLMGLWQNTVEGIDQVVTIGVESGKSHNYFQMYKDLLLQLHGLFWPRDLEREMKIEKPAVFQTFVDTKSRLSYLEKSVEDLKVEYYFARFKRQKSSPVFKNEHGSITIRTGFVESSSSIVVELLNARNLKSYDSNNLSDPYAMITVTPKEFHPSVPTFTTKTHKETLFPLFDETFTFPISLEDFRKPGFLTITLYDYDLFGRDDLMGEVFYPLSEIKKLENSEELELQIQSHLAVCKPDDSDSEMLQKFDDRPWDKEAVKFARSEREKMK